MKRNRRLERYQKGYYEQEKSLKTFDVSIPGLGDTSYYVVSSLKIDRSKITLRFLRKGLFSDRDKPKFKSSYRRSMLVLGENYKWEEINRGKKKKDKIQLVKEKDVDRPEELAGVKLKDFKVAATSLNRGYLYLFEKDKKHAVLEYQVGNNGQLYPVHWYRAKDRKGNYKDQRASSDKPTLEVQVIRDSKFRIAYSRVQWTTDKVESVLSGDSNANEELTLFECEGYQEWNSGKEMEHVPYNNLLGQFSSPEQKEYGEFLKSALARIAVDEERTDSTPLKEDMFLILDDHLGCSEDIRKEVQYQTNYLKATVESIKRGEGAGLLYGKIIQDEILEAPKGVHKKVSTMVLLAQTIYRMVFSNKKMKDEFAKHLDEKKLKRILGIEERKKLRDRLKKSRRDLFGLLGTGELKKAITLDKSWSDEDTVDILMLRSLLHSTFLDSDPYFIDSSLGIPEKEGNEPDSFADKDVVDLYAEEIDEPSESLFKKLQTGADWTKKIYSVAGLYMKISAVIVDRKIPVSTIYKFEQTIDTLSTRLNKLGLSTTRTSSSVLELIEQSKVIGAPVASNLVGPSDHLPTVRVEDGSTTHSSVDNDGKITKKRLSSRRVHTIQITEWSDTSQSKNVSSRIQDSTHFKNFGRLLNILNLGFASDQMLNDSKWKSKVNTGTAAMDLASDLFTIAEARNALGKGKWWKGFGKGLGIIGAIVGFGMSVHDSYMSAGKRDYDTAGLQAGAAVAFGLSAVATFGGPAMMLGPFGWAALAIGLIIVSIFTSDSNLETFFKNIAFSKEHKYTKPKSLPTSRHNLGFFYARKRLDSSGDHKWHDFEKAFVDFTEMIIVPKIGMMPMAVKNKISNTGNFGTGDMIGTKPITETATTTQGDVSKFKLTIGIRQFLHHKDQLEIHTYLFKDGLGKKTGKTKFSPSFKTVLIPGDKDNPPTLEVRFSVPADIMAKYSRKSRMLVLCRLKLGKDRYYPYSLEGKERFIGIAANVKVSDYQPGTEESTLLGDWMVNEKVRIDTPEKLRSRKKW